MCSVNQRGHMIRHDKCVHLFEIKPLVVNVWRLFIYYFRYIKSRFSCEFVFSLEAPYLRDTNGTTLFMFIFIISIILHINFVHFVLKIGSTTGGRRFPYRLLYCRSWCSIRRCNKLTRKHPWSSKHDILHAIRNTIYHLLTMSNKQLNAIYYLSCIRNLKTNNWICPIH